MEPKEWINFIDQFVRMAANIPEAKLVALGMLGCLGGGMASMFAIAATMRGSQHSRMLREAGLISED